MAEEVMAAFMMYIMKKSMVKFIIRSKCVNMTFYMLYTSTMSLRESPHNTNLYNLQTIYIEANEYTCMVS